MSAAVASGPSTTSAGDTGMARTSANSTRLTTTSITTEPRARDTNAMPQASFTSRVHIVSPVLTA